ncbi:MAG: serine/threonine-protein kinase [Polyangiaceae bacterium]
MMEASADGSPSSAHIPAALGRYELLGTLGQGGMANVYLGRLAGSAGFQRLYAIKVLHPHLASEDAFVEMLLDEARIAARLHHPNVVPIVDLGTEAGFYYVVMEYVEGFALSLLLKKNRESRPPRLLIPIILDALAGLHAAHTLVDDDGNPMNLVHRDVSPQNILVGSDGVARITDFGIAKAEARINSTRPGELKGKLSFMSPEQIREPNSVDARSDVFSAGVLLWSALTGEQPFVGASSAATLNNILKMDLQPPSQVGLKPPAVFDEICMHALQREAPDRTGSALEMEEALRTVAAANNMLDSRRKVAEWVRSSFAEELKARRDMIRGTIGSRGGTFVGSRGSGTMMRAQLTEGSFSTKELTLTPSKLSAAQAAAEAEAEVIVQESSKSSRALRQLMDLEQNEARSRGMAKWLIAAGLIFLGAVGATWFAKLHPAAPEPQAAQPVQAPAQPAPSAAPAATPAVVAATPPAEAKAPAAPLAPAAGLKNKLVRGRAEAAAPKSPARPAAEPSAAPPTTPKRSVAWDSDSSLPPP